MCGGVDIRRKNEGADLVHVVVDTPTSHIIHRHVIQVPRRLIVEGRVQVGMEISVANRRRQLVHVVHLHRFYSDVQVGRGH
jgi:hypothetical protein